MLAAVDDGSEAPVAANERLDNAEWTPSFLECGASGTALRTPSRDANDPGTRGHRTEPHRANDRCRQSELFSTAKAAPEGAALQK